MASNVGQHGRSSSPWDCHCKISKRTWNKQWPPTNKSLEWNLWIFPRCSANIFVPLYLCECEYNFDSMLHTEHRLSSSHSIPVSVCVCAIRLGVYVPLDGINNNKAKLRESLITISRFHLTALRARWRAAQWLFQRAEGRKREGEFDDSLPGWANVNCMPYWESPFILCLP